MNIALPHNFRPRPYQLGILDAIDSGILRCICCWHRRSGKDKTFINLMAKKMMERVGAYYYIFPTYTQAKKVIWRGMDKTGMRFISHFPKPLMAKPPNQTDMLIEYKNGSIFQLLGSDNIDSIVGTNPIGVVFSEFSLQDPRAWEYLRPILVENGGWAIFNFTPRGKNHAYDLLEMAKLNPAWFCEVFGVNDTRDWDGKPIITDAMIEEERRSGMSEDMIQQEYYVAFNAVMPGAYYGDQIKWLEENNRMVKGLWDPKLPVETWWDLGMDDAMTITFTQQYLHEIRIIDYLENSGEGLAYYANELNKKGYTYKHHHFPHDGEVKELGTGKTRKEVAMSLGIKPLDCIPAPPSKLDGIQAVRTILPRCWIDAEKCQRLIDCLKNYTKEWDEERKVWKSYPLHNWASHGADSFQTFALGHKQKLLKAPTIRKPTYVNGRPIYNNN